MRLGQPLPDRILNAPTLDKGQDFYIDAFFELCSDRSIGFGEGPIPTTSILTYAKHYDMDGEEESDFLYFIRELDNAYLAYRSKSSKSGKSKKK